VNSLEVWLCISENCQTNFLSVFKDHPSKTSGEDQQRQEILFIAISCGSVAVSSIAIRQPAFFPELRHTRMWGMWLELHAFFGSTPVTE